MPRRRAEASGSIRQLRRREQHHAPFAGCARVRLREATGQTLERTVRDDLYAAELEPVRCDAGELDLAWAWDTTAHLVQEIVPEVAANPCAQPTGVDRCPVSDQVIESVEQSDTGVVHRRHPRCEIGVTGEAEHLSHLGPGALGEQGVERKRRRFGQHPGRLPRLVTGDSAPCRVRGLACDACMPESAGIGGDEMS
jgi:hypothetical protein